MTCCRPEPNVGHLGNLGLAAGCCTRTAAGQRVEGGWPLGLGAPVVVSANREKALLEAGMPFLGGPRGQGRVGERGQV